MDEILANVEGFLRSTKKVRHRIGEQIILSYAPSNSKEDYNLPFPFEQLKVSTVHFFNTKMQRLLSRRLLLNSFLWLDPFGRDQSSFSFPCLWVFHKCKLF